MSSDGVYVGNLEISHVTGGRVRFAKTLLESMLGHTCKF